MENRITVTIIVIGCLLLTGCAPLKEFERARAVGVPVLVEKLYSGYPNSAGGVDVHATFWNTSNQTLKYVVLTVLPYNRVGDIAPSEIWLKTDARLRFTGPIRPGQSNGLGARAVCVWYNHSIRSIKLSEVEVTYMSGETESFSGNEVSKLLIENYR